MSKSNVYFTNVDKTVVAGVVTEAVAVAAVVAHTATGVKQLKRGRSLPGKTARTTFGQ